MKAEGKKKEWIKKQAKKRYERVLVNFFIWARKKKRLRLPVDFFFLILLWENYKVSLPSHFAVQGFWLSFLAFRSSIIQVFFHAESKRSLRHQEMLFHEAKFSRICETWDCKIIKFQFFHLNFVTSYVEMFGRSWDWQRWRIRPEMLSTLDPLWIVIKTRDSQNLDFPYYLSNLKTLSSIIIAYQILVAKSLVNTS